MALSTYFLPVAEATWQAFWQTAVEQRPFPEVAQALMTTGAVYVTRSLVLARIRDKGRAIYYLSKIRRRRY